VATAPPATAVSVNSASVQLSPAVMLIGKFDWQVDPASKPGEPWSRWVALQRQQQQQQRGHVAHEECCTFFGCEFVLAASCCAGSSFNEPKGLRLHAASLLPASFCSPPDVHHVPSPHGVLPHNQHKLR
jgi:hypothetical protein